VWVEPGQIGALADGVDALLSGARDTDRETGAFERVTDGVGDVSLVFDDDDTSPRLGGALPLGCGLRGRASLSRL